MTDESTSNGECIMTLEERMTCLEQANRRLRFTVAGLAALIGLSFVAGMTAAAPDELALRRLSIVDSNGKQRIVLDGTNSDGTASMAHYDTGGKMRILTFTGTNGMAATGHYDTGGTARIVTVTDSTGDGSTTHYDTNRKQRIVTATDSTGLASTAHYDTGGRSRIVTATIETGDARTMHFDKGDKLTVQIGEATDGAGIVLVSDPTGRKSSSKLVTGSR